MQGRKKNVIIEEYRYFAGRYHIPRALKEVCRVEVFRKIMLAAGVVSFCICGLFLNGMGGIAMTMYDGYSRLGVCLILSTLLFGGALAAAFFRKGAADIISVILNIAATALWIYPVASLNAVPNEQVPKTAMEVLTGRIYPAAIITVTLAAAVFGNVFSYDRIAAREEKKRKKREAQNRPLNDNEKII